MARRIPKSRSTRRRHGARPLPPALLVVCEGQTEARLLRELRGRLRIASAQIHVEGGVGVPSTIVRRAKALRADLKPTETWVVFDRDEFPCWRQAINDAHQARPSLKLAHSNPCFEQWALWLHQAQRAELHRHEIQRRLARVHRGYHHERNPYLDIDIDMPLLDRAKQRAAEAREAAERLGETDPVPMSAFSDLIDRLRSLA